MNERGRPRHAGYSNDDRSDYYSGHDSGYWGESFSPSAGWSQNSWAPRGRAHGGHRAQVTDWESTDWFTPVSAAQTTAVGVLDRPEPRQSPAYPAKDYPSFPPAALEITPNDVREALGPDADDMLSTADIDVDELIRLINQETTVMPPLVLPDNLPETDDDQGPPPEVVEAIGTWKRRFLKGAIAAVIVTLTGSGGAAAAMDKSVKVEVDGHETSVNTYDSTVGEVLKDEGIQVGPHDALSPSPQAPVGQGDSITLDRGRLMTINVDGQQRQEWVRSVTVAQALQQLGVEDDGAWVSADRNQAVPEKGMELTVNTSKSVTMTDGGGDAKPIKTNAVTVQDLVKEQQLNLGPEDSVTPGTDQKISDGVSVQINRTGSKVVNVTQSVAPPEQEIVDQSMFKGDEKVEKQGTPGEKIVFTRVDQRNGEETDRSSVGEKVTKEPTPTVKRVGGKEAPDSAVWDKLVKCEGGGNWATDSGNGYYGGLQFDKKTWDSNGGSQFAAYPHQASREQQIQVATKIRDSRGGYGAWPSCAKKIGLDS